LRWRLPPRCSATRRARFPGQPVPPKAIDGDFALLKLHWTAWGAKTAHGTGRIG
jgi:hypothetical protein